MRSRLLGAHLGVSFLSGMLMPHHCPWGVSSKVAEVAVDALVAFCSATATQHPPLSIIPHTYSLGGFLPLIFKAFLHLSAMDVWARTSMKGAAKCDERCELQNSVNQ